MKSGVGLDSCVVLRLLTGLPQEQFVRARDFLEECQRTGEQVWVNDLVVAEVYHALIYYYDIPPKTALDALRKFLTSPNVRCAGHATEMLAECRGTGAGLGDRLIRADLLDRVDRLVSFDKDFCRLAGVQTI